MISVLLYGRHDNHGYNLAKRTTIGLNCLAEVLTDWDDEIHFVDCNSPDHFSTRPESVADTLTPKCRRLLRVWRFRPQHFAKYGAGSTLPVLESLCRNIALRRSNPANRWVLSSNPDMIFAPRRRFDSLSKIAARQRDGFYELPRFELPEAIWESFDRRNPRACIKAAREAGDALRLNYIVHGPPFGRFSGLGDFQLVLREQLAAIGGFDEAMVRGWHVDTNLAKRLWLLNGVTKSLDADLAGYHCDHLRQASRTHSTTGTENSFARFVDEVERPGLTDQQPEWGLPDLDLELVRLDESRAPWAAGIPPLDGEVLEMSLHTGQHWHDVGTALVHLASEFQHLPRHHGIGYIGCSPAMRDGLARLLVALGFERPLACADHVEDIGGLVARCDLVLLDGDLTPSSADMKRKHWKLSSLDPRKPQGEAARRHFQHLRAWLVGMAEAARALPEGREKNFLLRGFWASPLKPLAMEYFDLTLAPPATGFVPARIRRDSSSD